MMANTSLTRLDPFSFVDDIARTLRAPLAESAQRHSGFVPAVDACRDGEDLVLRADLPGIDPENDVSVELSGRTLNISGERCSENDAEGLREVRYGSFSRTVTLPNDVSEENVTADYDAGVLNVRVAGVYAEERPQRIKVTTGVRQTAIGEKDEKEEIDA